MNGAASGNSTSTKLPASFMRMRAFAPTSSWKNVSEGAGVGAKRFVFGVAGLPLSLMMFAASSAMNGSKSESRNASSFATPSSLRRSSIKRRGSRDVARPSFVTR